MACSLMCYWEGLFLEANREALVDGANTMLAIAWKLLTKKSRKETPLLLKDDQEGGQNGGA